jgi:hypothetical protein
MRTGGRTDESHILQLCTFRRGHKMKGETNTKTNLSKYSCRLFLLAIIIYTILYHVRTLPVKLVSCYPNCTGKVETDGDQEQDQLQPYLFI